MKKFVICILGIIFITLITSAVQSTSAEGHIPIEGLFTDESGMEVELVTTKDTKYKIYLQLVFRLSIRHATCYKELSTAFGKRICHIYFIYIFAFRCNLSLEPRNVEG